MKKIGLLEVKGALTLYEHFGHLPTNIVKSDGTIENGKKDHHNRSDTGGGETGSGSPPYESE
jgi:hypothetical protein